MAKKKNSRSKFAEAIDPRFTGVVQTLKNEAKISNIPKKFFKREVNSDRNEAFQKYLYKRWYDYMESTVRYVTLPLEEQQRNKMEFPEIEEVELLHGILIPLFIEEKTESPPDVPILPQNSVIEESNRQEAPLKKKKKKKTESPPCVPILPQNSVIKENDGQDAPPKKKRKNKLESPPDVPILSQNSDIEENNVQEAPPKKKKKKTESPPCVPILPQNSIKEENDEVDAPPKKKRKKEKVCKNKMTFDSDEAFQEHLRKRWYEYMESKVKYVTLSLEEQQRNKWEFPEIKEVELLPGIPMIPNKKEKEGQEAPPKKKSKKEKKKEKECFKEVAVTAEWLEKQAKLYIS